MIKTLQIDCMCTSLLLTACLVVGKNVSQVGKKRTLNYFTFKTVFANSFFSQFKEPA